MTSEQSRKDHYAAHSGVEGSQLKGLFLGAGASCELGMPLVWELTAELKHHITPERLRQINAAAIPRGFSFPDDVIEDAISMMSRSDVHYEHLLGYLEVQRVRARNLHQDYYGLNEWFTELVYRALYLRHKQRLLKIIPGLRFIDGIATLAEENKPLWVFTTNHDVVVDCLAAALKIPISYGFLGSKSFPRRDAAGTIVGSLHAQMLSKDDIDNGRYTFFGPGTKGINVIKIHGGLETFRFNDSESEVLRLLPFDDTPAGPILSLISANEEVYHPQARLSGVSATNQIAYADEVGELQFLRRTLLAGTFKYDERHPQVLPRMFLPLFRDSIIYVSHLVCIGYSFGDDHIDEIMRGWLEVTKQRRLEIVSPSAAVPSTLKHIAPQVSVVHQKWMAYLEPLSPRPLTLDERALKAGLEAMHKTLSEDFNTTR